MTLLIKAVFVCSSLKDRAVTPAEIEKLEKQLSSRLDGFKATISLALREPEKIELACKNVEIEKF